jgi:hypothetical protein
MEIARLKLRLIGTKRSRVLKENEEVEVYIPTWLPNPEMGLNSFDDYVKYVVNESWINSGDLIANIIVETVSVSDTKDFKDPYSPYFSDKADGIDWEYRYSIVGYIIEVLVRENQIFVSEDCIYESALELYQNTSQNILGWMNADPADVIDNISHHLIVNLI